MRGAAVAALVLSGHAAVFAAIGSRSVADAPAEPEPMMVSLVADSEPVKPDVQAKPQPVQPKPRKVEPVVKRQPQPTLQPKPEPVPVTAEAAPQPQIQPESPQPHQEKVAEVASPPEPAAPAAKEVEVAPEPVYQPPRFGVAYLRNPSPEYPPISRRLKEQGKVMLRVMVTTAGEPGSIEVDKSSGFERLDQAAIEAVKQWRFVPAKRGEQAVNAWVVVPLSFSVKG
jgi:protein TonB